MGKPSASNFALPVCKDGSVPGEVKHLSSQRKIKHSAQAQHTLSSGERKGHSPNPSFVSLLILDGGCRKDFFLNTGYLHICLCKYPGN